MRVGEARKCGQSKILREANPNHMIGNCSQPPPRRRRYVEAGIQAGLDIDQTYGEGVKPKKVPILLQITQPVLEGGLS